MIKRQICPNYCGDNCVNGNCPAAIFGSEASYSVESANCKICGYYKGCDDCHFLEGENTCVIEKSSR